MILKEKPLSELLRFSFINLNKPSGPTSFEVSSYVCRALGLNKTSHLGTLDPAVSGVLPIALGRACKLNEIFMHHNKKYVGIMRLHKEVSKREIEEAIEKNIGKITQKPPVKSAVKRQERQREIFFFNILEIQGKDVLFETEVEAGKYIRTLCIAIGKDLGEAHMLELRRVKAGIFQEDDKKHKFISLYDFDKAVKEYKEGDEKPLRKILVPAEQALLEIMPKIELEEKNLKQFLTGKPLMKKDIKRLPQEETFAGFVKDIFIGVYRKTEKDKQDIIARPLFIFN